MKPNLSAALFFASIIFMVMFCIAAALDYVPFAKLALQGYFLSSVIFGLAGLFDGLKTGRFEFRGSARYVADAPFEFYARAMIFVIYTLANLMMFWLSL